MWNLYIKDVRDLQWKVHTCGQDEYQLDAEGQDLLEKEACVSYFVGANDLGQHLPCYLNQPGP